MGDLWVTPIVVRGLSVGYACYPWVTPVGFTHGCVLIAALRFEFLCGLMVQQDRSPGQSEATPRVAQCLYLLRPAGAKG